MPSDIRELSKKYAPQVRSETAAEIRKIRRLDSDRRQQILKDIEVASGERELQSSKLEELQKQLDDIDATIAEKNRTFVASMANFFDVRNIKKVRESRERQIDEVKSQYAKTLDLLRDHEEQKQDTKLVEDARRTLDSFYEQQLKKLPQYEAAEEKAAQEALELRAADRKARNVAETMKRHDTFIVHGIRPDRIPGENSLLREDTDWKIKLKIALALSPELSTSSFRGYDTDAGLWGPFGVVLRDGEITSANNQDQGSQAKMNLRRRAGFTNSGGTAEMQIYNSIMTKGGSMSKYNELTVRNPEIAGLFIYPDARDPRSMNGTPEHSEIYQMATEAGFPVYILEQGKCFVSEYDQATSRFIKKESVTVDNIVSSQEKVDEKILGRYREEIFTDSPFRLEQLPEFMNVDSIACGKELYIVLSVGKDPSRFEGPTEDENGKQKRMIATVPSSGKINKYFVMDGLLYHDRIQSASKKREWRDSLRYRDVADFSYIRIGYNTSDLGNPVRGVREYLRLMVSKIEEGKDNLEKVRSGRNMDEIAYQEQLLARLTSHVYGFGVQASEMGDESASTAAMAVVRGAGFEESYFEKLLTRRIGPDGEMKITEADLGQKQS